MAKSIIQTEKECYLCRIEADKNGYYGGLRQTGLHKHHFIYGRFGAFRKKAERFGLWAYMCAERHHEHGPESPHGNPEVDLALKRVAQEAFEKSMAMRDGCRNLAGTTCERRRDGKVGG